MRPLAVAWTCNRYGAGARGLGDFCDRRPHPLVQAKGADCRQTIVGPILIDRLREKVCAMHPLRPLVFSVLLAINVPAVAASPPERRPELDRIGHIIVVFLENRSFDHLYGLFPGAEGIQYSGFASIQVSAEGRQFETLPAVTNNLARLGGIELTFCRRPAERTVPCRPVC